MKQAISIPSGAVKLPGDLTLPEGAKGLVLFVHGSGSSRLSPRNVFVADVLNDAGIATLLFDLLTEKEDETYETRFDIDLLTERLLDATHWVEQQDNLKKLALGYFGASTGAAAALQAAAKVGDKAKAVVSRGGRPDLTGEVLPDVVAPTLLIVGGDDDVVIGMNQEAYDQMTCEKQLEIVPGATHLFEEPGTLEQVSELAKDWFLTHLK